MADAGMPPGETTDFAAEARGVLEGLRRSLRQLADALPGVATPNAMRDTLGVSYKLAWQVFTLIKAPDPLQCAGNLPGMAAARGLVAAATKKGVSGSVTSAVTQAFEEVERLIARHAADREEFASLATGSAGSLRQGDVTRRHRRAIYRGYAHLLQMSVRTHLRCELVHLGPDGGLNYCSVRGLLSLVRFRVDRPVVVHFSLATQRGTSTPLEIHALEPEALSTLGAPLMTRVMKAPPPQFQHGTAPDGLKWTAVLGGGVGERNAIDLIFGDYIHFPPLPDRDASRPRFGSTFLVRLPAERLIFDVLIHRASFGRARCEVKYSQSAIIDGKPEGRSPPTLLDLTEQFRRLGPVPTRLSTPHVPRYNEMIDAACGKMGWKAADFDVYRLEVLFPPLQSAITASFYPI